MSESPLANAEKDCEKLKKEVLQVLYFKGVFSLIRSLQLNIN